MRLRETAPWKIADACICGNYPTHGCNDTFRTVLSGIHRLAIALPRESELAINSRSNVRLAAVFREVLQ